MAEACETRDTVFGADVSDVRKYLRPRERIVMAVPAPLVKPVSLPDAGVELAKMASVDDPKDIGRNGPPVAAISAPGGENDPGQHKYECWFGRDALLASIFLLEQYPMLCRSTLMAFAAYQGVADVQKREEEFGKILHEHRMPGDPKAAAITAEYGWRWPYYGSADSTSLFLVALGRYCALSPEGYSFLQERYVGKGGVALRIADACDAAAAWIVRRMHSNREMMIEYKPSFEGSLENQTLEDSFDSHFFEDGSLPDFGRGVASPEIQGFAYDALSEYMAILSVQARLDESRSVDVLRGRLERSMLQMFWTEDERGGYFAVGCGRDERGWPLPMRVRKLMPQTVIGCGIFVDRYPDLVDAVVATLFHPSMLAETGLRTLAVGEPRFMPGSYHNGSIWPVENYLIALALRKRGYFALAHEMENRLVRSVEETRMYPEFFRGDEEGGVKLNERIVDTYDEDDGRGNRREQPPQEVQLFTLAAYSAIMQTRERCSNPPPRPSEKELKILKKIF